MDDDSQDPAGARKRALEQYLGPADDRLFRAFVPLEPGGKGDVLSFSHYASGVTYATSALTGRDDQPANDAGKNYELMMCASSDIDWMPGLLSHLGAKSLETILKSGEAVDMGEALIQDSALSALLYCEPIPPYAFEVRGKPSMLLLCIGITASELDFCRAHGAERLVELLKEKRVFPYTDVYRAAVI